MRRFIQIAILIASGPFLSSSCLAPPSSLASRDYPPTSPPVKKRAEAYAHYATGIIKEMHQETETAWEHFFLSAMSDPDHYSLVGRVAQRLLSNQDAEKARKLLTRSLQNPNAPPTFRAYLALAYAQLDEVKRAIAENQKAIAQAPDTLQAYKNLARIYTQQGENEKALRILQKAGSIESPSVSYLIELAEMHLRYARLSQFDQTSVRARALKLLNRISPDEISQNRLRVKAADLYKELGRLDRAESLYRHVATEAPDWPDIHEKLVGIYLQTGQHEKAGKELKSLVRKRPTDPTAHYLLGNLAQERNNLADAADHLESALELNPKLQPAYYQLAGVYVNQRKPKKALEILKRAGKQFKENFIGQFYAALAHLQLDYYREATRHFTEAEVIAKANNQQNRLNRLFFFQAGIAYERQQDYETAAEYFQKALDRDPEFAEALNYLGYMWTEQGVRLKKAHKLIKKAVELEPKNAAYLDSLGWVLFKLDRPRQAKKYLLQAIEEAESPDATLYEHLGDIYSKLGLSGEARDAWQKALEISPSDAVKEKLKGASTQPKSPSPPH